MSLAGRQRAFGVRIYGGNCKLRKIHRGSWSFLAVSPDGNASELLPNMPF